jgi:hypothetical protein
MLFECKLWHLRQELPGFERQWILGGKSSDETQPLPAGTIFFYAEVTTARLQTLTPLFEAGRITARVGSVLPLSEARQAQGMLAGAPHKSCKIVLQIGRPQ